MRLKLEIVIDCNVIILPWPKATTRPDLIETDIVQGEKAVVVADVPCSGKVLAMAIKSVNVIFT